MSVPAVDIAEGVQVLIQILSNAMDLATKIQTAHENGGTGLTDQDVTDFAGKYNDTKTAVDNWLAGVAQAASASSSTPPATSTAPA